MAQINPPKPLVTNRPDELREDGLQTAYVRSSSFFDEHRTAILAGLAALVVLVAAVVGYRAWQSNRSEEAQRYLGSILSEYQQGNYQTALDGTDETPGLLEIAERYGSTATGEQAAFLAADALYQLGRYDEALEMFEGYSGDDLLEASAFAGQAAVYEAQGEFGQAASLYERAAGAVASPAATPGYLLDAGRAHLAAGDAAAAVALFERVVDEFPDGPEALQAQTELGRAEAQATAVGQPTGDVQAAPVDTSAAAPARVISGDEIVFPAQ